MLPPRPTATELLGVTAGGLLAPWVALGSALRRGRLFHPEGFCFRAEVEPARAAARFSSLGERLAGAALVRLSTALWGREREWPDVLGCSIRFVRDHPVGGAPGSGDQDLLFATIPRSYLTPVGFLFSRPQDFLTNVYHGVSPFDAGPGVGWIYLRVATGPSIVTAGTRSERLLRAVRDGTAVLRVEAAPAGDRRVFSQVAQVRLLEQLDVDQRSLELSPFRTGRGIMPRGFVHAMRALTYPASRRARSRTNERDGVAHSRRPPPSEAAPPP